MKLLFFIFCSSVLANVDAHVGTGFSVFDQPGMSFSNQGYASEVTAGQDLNSGLTLRQSVGYEHFVGDATGEHHGARALVSGEYPLGPTNQLSANAGYRTLGRNWGDFTLGVGFESKKKEFELAVAFQRSFVMDSYVSYVGKTFSDEIQYGGARLQEFHAEMTWNNGIFRYRLKPALGWISAGTTPTNFKGSFGGSAELLMIQEDVFDLALIYEAGLQHYQYDSSAISYSREEPFSGGYFSPRLMVEQVPHIAAFYRPEQAMEFSLKIGPSFQLYREFQKGDSFEMGPKVSLGLDYAMNSRASMKVNVDYATIVNRYQRFQSNLELLFFL